MGDLSGLGAIASGVQAGLESYRGERELKLKREQQERERQVQDALLAEKGLEWNPEGTLQKSPRGLLLEQEATALKAAPYQAKGLMPKIEGGRIVGFDRDPNAPRSMQDIQREKSLLEIDKLKKEGSQGKILPASKAEALGGANASYKAIDDMNAILGQAGDITGPFQGLLSKGAAKFQIGDLGAKSAATQSQLKSRAQTIGRYLEGGKLTDEDIRRYETMIPQITDKPIVAKSKIDNLKRLVAQKQSEEMSAIQGAGYNVANIPTVAIPEIPTVENTAGLLKQKTPINSIAAPGVPKLGEIQEGYQFKGGNPADPNAWEKL